MQLASSRPHPTGKGYGFIALLLTLVIFSLFGTAQVSASEAAAKPLVIKYATLVIDADTGRVLQETNADEVTYPASLTKMMTLYLAFDALKDGKLKLNQPMKTSARAARQSPTKMNLAPNETITVEQGILSLVIKSANDVAVVFAETIAGTEEQFALEMTAKARKLGMSKTVFRNASGLPHKGQVTTARDMAKMARALLRDHPDYYAYFGREQFTYKGAVIRTHNRLLNNFEGADGIKTGYIHASGFNLVSSVKRDGRRLIGVVLGGKSQQLRDQQMARLLDASFDKLVNGREPVIREAVMRRPAAEQAHVAMEQDAALRGGSDDDSPASSGWGVQVGAYYSSKTAAEVARKAISQASNQLSDGVVKILPAKMKDGRTLYRGRVSGVSKKQAYDACRILKKAQYSCMEFRATTEDTQMASTTD